MLEKAPSGLKKMEQKKRTELKEAKYIYISIQNPNIGIVLGLGILTMVLPTYLPTTTTTNNNT